MLKKYFSLVLLVTVILSAASFALDFRSGDNITIPKGTVIKDNLFISGNNVIVSGIVNGNLFAAGEDIIVDGRVTGTIFACGGKVYLSGSAGNVVAVGGTINIDGKVNNDLLVGGGQIHLGKGSRVGRDAMLGTGKLTIAPKSTINGNFTYSSSKANISKQAIIMGKINVIAQPEVPRESSKFLAGMVTAHKIISFLAIILLGSLIIIFMPNQVELISTKMTSEGLKSLGWGILSLLVIPLTAILLMITLVGLPLGAMLLTAYGFCIYLVGVFVSIVIGKWILDKVGKVNISLIWALLIGMLVAKILTMIPIIGWLIGFLMFLWAFGAIVSTRHSTYLAAREAKVL